mmetsp:Transcript_46136/g.82397  ORF Transcript_46136/g.82397 Transcript_46136/m.82397 type:complete len:311 (-) Transcript_46136:49-981(-)
MGLGLPAKLQPRAPSSSLSRAAPTAGRGFGTTGRGAVGHGGAGPGGRTAPGRPPPGVLQQVIHRRPVCVPALQAPHCDLEDCWISPDQLLPKVGLEHGLRPAVALLEEALLLFGGHEHDDRPKVPDILGSFRAHAAPVQHPGHPKVRQGQGRRRPSGAVGPQGGGAHQNVDRRDVVVDHSLRVDVRQGLHQLESPIFDVRRSGAVDLQELQKVCGIDRQDQANLIRLLLPLETFYEGDHPRVLQVAKDLRLLVGGLQLLLGVALDHLQGILLAAPLHVEDIGVAAPADPRSASVVIRGGHPHLRHHIIQP